MILNEYNNAMMAIAESVRNKCADICSTISVKHLANSMVWSQEGVDPLEIAGEDGGKEAAFECELEIRKLDCHEMLCIERDEEKENTLVAHAAIFDALFEVFPDCQCIGDLPGFAKQIADDLAETRKFLEAEFDVHMELRSIRAEIATKEGK